MRWRLFSIAVLVLGALCADSAGEGVRISHGRTLFMDPCYRCHPLAEHETGKIAPRIKSMDVFSFAAAVWNQSPNMLKALESKGWKLPVIEPTEMLEIFLFTQVMADQVQMGDPERGKQFVQRNRCLVCHSIGGQGGTIGPAWDRFANVLHPTQLMSAIWLHRLQMIGAFKQQRIPLPALREGDLADLMAFMRQTGKSAGVAPILVDLGNISIEPGLFDKFRCKSCHNPHDFAGHPERSLQMITESLLTHAFKPAFEKPPLDSLAMTPEDSLSLAGLVYYYSRLAASADAAKGKSVFRQHGCNECHDEPDSSSRDGVVIEPIRDYWDLISRVFNKVPRMIEKAMVESRAFPRLTREEMADLYAYLCASSAQCTAQPVLANSKQ